MGGPRSFENTRISLHFHYFFGAVESVGSSGIIENTQISMHFRNLLCGAESVGSSIITENIWISIHFQYFFGGAESVGSSRIIESYSYVMGRQTEMSETHCIVRQYDLDTPTHPHPPNSASNGLGCNNCISFAHFTRGI